MFLTRSEKDSSGGFLARFPDKNLSDIQEVGCSARKGHGVEGLPDNHSAGCRIQFLRAIFVTKRETGEEGEGREVAQALFICSQEVGKEPVIVVERSMADICLLYTSDAADE